MSFGELKAYCNKRRKWSQLFNCQFGIFMELSDFPDNFRVATLHWLGGVVGNR